MRRSYFFDLLIDGKPVLTPDCDIEAKMTDLDDADSGRDASGVMHRIVLRHDMKSIPLLYKVLAAKEYLYMESLFRGKDEFEVKYRDLSGRVGSFVGYRSNHGITIHNAKTGICKNYKFNIIEC